MKGKQWRRVAERIANRLDDQRLADFAHSLELTVDYEPWDRSARDDLIDRIIGRLVEAES